MITPPAINRLSTRVPHQVYEEGLSQAKARRRKEVVKVTASVAETSVLKPLRPSAFTIFPGNNALRHPFCP